MPCKCNCKYIANVSLFFDTNCICHFCSITNILHMYVCSCIQIVYGICAEFQIYRGVFVPLYINCIRNIFAI